MADFLLCKYNTQESYLHVISSGDFVANKEKYHIKWSFRFGNQDKYYEYELTRKDGAKLPAVIFVHGGVLINDPPVYYELLTAPELRCATYSKLAGNSNDETGILSGRLVDSGGELDIEMTGSGWNVPEWKDFIGTVSDCVLDVTIETDFPIFISDWQVQDNSFDMHAVGQNYANDAVSDDITRINNCLYGDGSSASDAANTESVVNTIPRQNRYYINNILRKNGTIVARKRYEFMIAPGGKIGFVANIPHDPIGLYYNMYLRISGSGLTFLYREGGTGDSWTTGHLITTELGSYYYGEWTDYSNGDFYKATTDTNIPIWRDEIIWNAYVDGNVGQEEAENGGQLARVHASTGSDLDSSDISSPSIGASGIGANVWALTQSQLKDIFDILYDDDQTLIDDIKKGIWVWGNNPMDFVISVYFVPFDVSNFYTLSTGNHVYFGSYDSGLSLPKVVENKTSNRIVLCETPIESVYGDYRDLTQFTYELFLPYIGFIPLDINAFLDKMLKVEMCFDIMTHNIRYYIYANNIIQERVDGSVGYDIPLMGTDQVNKAKSDVQAVKDAISLGADVVKSGAEPTIGDVANSVSSCIDIYRGFASKPSAKIIGGISSSMNIYDITYVYLKVTEKNTIKPAKLNRIYNKPSYYIGSASALSGYCEISDIQLVCNATEAEIREIKQLLKEGVIF